MKEFFFFFSMVLNKFEMKNTEHVFKNGQREQLMGLCQPTNCLQDVDLGTGSCRVSREQMEQEKYLAAEGGGADSSSTTSETDFLSSDSSQIKLPGGT